MNQNDNPPSRKKIALGQDGRTVLIEDSPGVSVEVDRGESRVIEVADGEWQEAKKRLATHDLSFNAASGRFNAKKRKLDKGREETDNEEELIGKHLGKL